MIISRTPLRLCLVGGGTDVPDFYHRDYGAVVTCTLASYVYVLVSRQYDGTVQVDGPGGGTFPTTAAVTNPLVREVLLARGLTAGVHVALFSDVPHGTGLGSSSALTVGLLNALDSYLGPSPRRTIAGGAGQLQRNRALDLAAEAYEIEIGHLGSNAGKLDQFSTAVGGLLEIRFLTDDSTVCRRIKASRDTLDRLASSMLLFHTGRAHEASAVMAGWRRNMRDKHAVLVRMRDQAAEVADVLATGDVAALGPLLAEAWQLKRSIADGITFPLVDAMYEAALAAGATGGKLAGAGGGGFLLVFGPPSRRESIRRALAGYAELPVRLTNDGTAVVFNDESEL